eukprot:11793163-Karenia_brevis.AAC.1
MPRPPKAIPLGPAPGPPPDAPPRAFPQPKQEAPVVPRLRLELPQMPTGSCPAQTALAVNNQFATEQKAPCST